jgi:hypothetical protein
MARRSQCQKHCILNGKEQGQIAVRVRQVFKMEKHGCGVIPANIGTTHGHSTHKGPNASNAKNKASKSPEKKEESQGNLAEIVMDDFDSNKLVMGAWCGFTTEFTNTIFMPVLGPTPKFTDTTTGLDATLGGWMMVVSHSSKKKSNATTCNTYHSLSPFIHSQQLSLLVTGVALKPLRPKFYTTQRIPLEGPVTHAMCALFNHWTELRFHSMICRSLTGSPFKKR